MQRVFSTLNILIVFLRLLFQNVDKEFQEIGFFYLKGNKKMNKVILSALLLATSANASKLAFSASVVGGLARMTTAKTAGGLVTAATPVVKANKSKNGFGAIALVNAMMSHKKINFGVVAGVMFNGSKPKNVTGTTTTKFKNKGVSLLAGPELSMKHGKFNFGTGVALTLSTSVLTSDNTASGALVNYELKTKTLRRVGAMPFVKAGYCLGSANLFALVGYNFQAKAKFTKNNASTPKAVADLVTAGTAKAKSSTLFIGAGASIKFN